MSRMFLGLKSGTPVLKIMADSADDPLTTLNTDWEKFRFNSENTEYSYIEDIIEWPLGVTTYWPPGSNSANYILKNEVVGGNDFVFCNAARAIALYGFLPMVLHRAIDIASGKVNYYRNDTIIAGNPFSMAKIKQIGGLLATAFYDNSFSSGHPGELVSAMPISGISNMSLITRFPCDRDYTALTGTPVSGDCFLSIDQPSGRCRVARGGFDARTAARTNCLIHEDQRPITTVAQGFASMTTGQTVTIPIGVDTPDGSFPFLIGATGLTAGVSKMTSLSYPSAGFFTPNMAFEAQVVGNDLVIKNNTNVTTTVFYVIMVENDQTPTTGGAGKILTTENDEVKMMRPGANVPPVPADILLWSQYKYCPLIAYGKIANTSFSGSTGSLTACTYDLTIPALANKPIVLCAVQKVGANADLNDGDVIIDGRYTSGFSGSTLWMSSWWQYDPATNKVTFTVVDTNNSGGGGWVLRYYILAVPD